MNAIDIYAIKYCRQSKAHSTQDVDLFMNGE